MFLFLRALDEVLVGSFKKCTWIIRSPLTTYRETLYGNLIKHQHCLTFRHSVFPLLAGHCRSTTAGLCLSQSAGGSQEPERVEVSCQRPPCCWRVVSTSKLVVVFATNIEIDLWYSRKTREIPVVKPPPQIIFNLRSSGCRIAGVCPPDNPAAVTAPPSVTRTHL